MGMMGNHTWGIIPETPRERGERLRADAAFLAARDSRLRGIQEQVAAKVATSEVPAQFQDAWGNDFRFCSSCGGPKTEYPGEGWWCPVGCVDE